MNKQGPNGIEWTDYTWNVVAGCQHGCRWTMPDGSTAICYAEEVAERLAGAAYPDGFAAHYWHPHRLEEPKRVKQPAKIFADSMSDLFGHWVPDEQVRAVLDAMREAHWHTFQTLTKHPQGYRKYRDVLPPNLWCGASTPPDVMFGRPLSREQQERMLHATLKVFGKFDVDSPQVTWLSAEPLSWDIVPVVQKYEYELDWIVIGAASNGRTLYPPEEAHVRRLVEYADWAGIPVFYKGNLRSLAWANEDWREDFPEGVRN